MYFNEFLLIFASIVVLHVAGRIQQTILVGIYLNSKILQREITVEQAEHARNEALLYRTIPNTIVDRMKSTKGLIFDEIAHGTVIFIKVEGFDDEFFLSGYSNTSEALDIATNTGAASGAESIVGATASNNSNKILYFLNLLYSEFDHLCDKEQCQKIKSIQNVYLACTGLSHEEDHSERIAKFALRCKYACDKISMQCEPDFAAPEQVGLKIGIASGNYCAAILGTTKFLYDIFGDTVNIASRMCYGSELGKIQMHGSALVSKLTAEQGFTIEPRGFVHVKGKGSLITYWLTAHRDIVPYQHSNQNSMFEKDATPSSMSGSPNASSPNEKNAHEADKQEANEKVEEDEDTSEKTHSGMSTNPIR